MIGSKKVNATSISRCSGKMNPKVFLSSMITGISIFSSNHHHHHQHHYHCESVAEEKIERE